MNYKLWFVLVLQLMFAGCASTTCPPRQVAESVAAETAVYAMMSANSYDKNDSFPLEKLGWSHQSFQREHGLAYHIYKKDKKIVFAIRGTENAEDWAKGNISGEQYEQMLNVVHDFEQKNPNSEIVAFTGHSLGGAIALYLSVMKNSPSAEKPRAIPAYAFDPSPRIFKAEHAEQLEPLPSRKVIFAEGEVLAKLRNVSHDWINAPVCPEIYRAKYDFGCEKNNSVCLHSSRKLALKLLEDGAKTDAELEKLCANTNECHPPIRTTTSQ